MSVLTLPTNDLEEWNLDKLLSNQNFIYIIINGKRILDSNRCFARCKTCIYGEIDGQNSQGNDITVCRHAYNQLKYCDAYKYDKLYRKKLSNWSANWVDSVLRDNPICKRTKEEKEKMVKRGKKEFVEIESFEGICESVDLEEGKAFDGQESVNMQYHMLIEPTSKEAIDIVADSKTQRLHNFIRISGTTTDDEIAEGSTLDNYITRIEECIAETKDFETHKEVFDCLVGRKFSWRNVKIGKAYKEYPAKMGYVPVAEILDKKIK